MAIFPCSVGQHPYPGKQNSVYVALASGAQMDRSRLRLCVQHAQAVRDLLDDHQVGNEAQLLREVDELASCATCNRPVLNAAQSVFVTAYWIGEERADYWLTLHDTCPLPRVLNPV